MSTHKMEGDGTTPIGLFAISSTFYGIDANPGVLGSYHRLVCGDWWDERPTSPEYNTFQHVDTTSCTDPENPFGGSSEALWTEAPAYDSFAVIEYNTDPVIAYRGSAIFLHDDIGEPTNGCVSLPAADLVLLMRWLQPADSPHIAIGIEGDLQQF